MSLSKNEIQRICSYVNNYLLAHGINVPYPYKVSLMSIKDIEMIKENLTEVEEGLYIDHKGLIIVRNDYLPNVVIEKIIKGIIALAVVHSYGKILYGFIEKLANELYDRVLVFLYSQKS